MEDRPTPSEATAELALAALEHAFTYLAEEPQFLATLIVESERLESAHELLQPPGAYPASRGVLPALADDPEPLLDRVHELAAELDAYAVVFDATVEVEDGERDAVLVIAGRRGEPHAWVFGELYTPVGEDRALAREDGAFILDTAQNRLAD